MTKVYYVSEKSALIKGLMILTNLLSSDNIYIYKWRVIMTEKLLSLIYNYSINGKLVDKEYIKKFIDIVVNSESLEKYVLDLQILSPEKKLPEGCIASYIPVNKTIYFDFNNINKRLNERDKYHVLFNEEEQIFYKNSFVSQFILHELEHANQYRIMDSEESLEAEILKLGKHDLDDDEINKLQEKGYSTAALIVYILEKRRIYMEFYLKSPVERLAEIKSHQEMIILLSNIKGIVPNLFDFEQAAKIESLLQGFAYEDGKVISPTIFYLKKMGEEQALKNFDWYDEDYFKALEKSKTNYSLADRLKYGLMIDESEARECLKTLKLSQKYNC